MFGYGGRKKHDTSTLSAPGQTPPSPVSSPPQGRLLSVLSALFLGALLCFGAGGFASGQTQGNVARPRGPSSARNGALTRQQVIAQARASVVWIHDQDCQKKDQAYAGSGVIIDRRGYIVTNFHLVNNAFDYQVKLFDDVDPLSWAHALPARLVGVDPLDDLAVLKITTSKRLAVMPFGNSSQLRIGDSVLTIGNPDAVPQTVTSGLVSALGRVLYEENQGAAVPLVDLVQTDAAINPGNSGGALVDTRGELVGIPTLHLTQYMLLGFAIPSNRVRFVVPQLIQYGRLVHHGHATIDATLVSANPQLAAQDGLSVSQGAFVNTITPGGPAARAGLARGDVIVQANDVPITNAADLTDALMFVDPGSPVTLQVVRGARHLRLRVIPREHSIKLALSWKCPLKNAQPIVGKG
jgi:putative serine protease PepD